MIAGQVAEEKISGDSLSFKSCYFTSSFKTIISTKTKGLLYPKGVNFGCKVDGDDLRLLAKNWLSSVYLVGW